MGQQPTEDQSRPDAVNPGRISRLVTPVIRDSFGNLLAIYFFGSAAQGQMNADSDIDLADMLSASTVMRMQIVSKGTRQNRGQFT